MHKIDNPSRILPEARAAWYLGKSKRAISLHQNHFFRKIQKKQSLRLYFKCQTLWTPSSASSKRRVTNTPLKKRRPRFKSFVNKQNESLGVLPLFSLPCKLREQRLRNFNSKDFMKGKKKMKNSIIEGK